MTGLATTGAPGIALTVKAELGSPTTAGILVVTLILYALPAVEATGITPFNGEVVPVPITFGVAGNTPVSSDNSAEKIVPAVTVPVAV